MFQPLIAEQVVHQVVKIAIMRELNMSAYIPGKTMLSDERRSEASGAWILVEYLHMCLADFRKAVGRAQTRRPSAENHYGLVC
jgi:hypothetical protein